MINYVSTKREYLPKYLLSMEKIEESNILSNDEIIGKNAIFDDQGVLVEVESYLNGLCLIRVLNEEYKLPKGVIRVPNFYTRENIANGLITVTNYTLEGTDGIGKTTSIEKLLSEGIVTFDRNLDVICKYMLFDVPMEKRIEEYKEYLKSTKDKILFLVNMDAEELRRRINSRDTVSEFDKYAVEYNQMYYDTYNELSKRNYLNDKLFMLDCTGLSPDEQKEKIKERILR